MADYICRETAIAKLTALEIENPRATMAEARRVLKNMPRADVVEVVRCKDCAWSETDKNGELDCTNTLGLFFAHPDSFCSVGERRKEHDGNEN